MATHERKCPQGPREPARIFKEDLSLMNCIAFKGTETRYLSNSFCRLLQKRSCWNMDGEWIARLAQQMLAAGQNVRHRRGTVTIGRDTLIYVHGFHILGNGNFRVSGKNKANGGMSFRLQLHPNEWLNSVLVVGREVRLRLRKCSGGRRICKKTNRWVRITAPETHEIDPKIEELANEVVIRFSHK